MSSRVLRARDLAPACECDLARDEVWCRTDAALDEFRRTGRCQACQDERHLARHPSDPGVRYHVRTGALAAMSAASGLAETVLLPFRWTVPAGPFAWDTARIVRVGPWLPPVDWTEDWASAMAPVLYGQRFVFHEFRAFGHEEGHLRTLLHDVELLIGVNERALCQVTRCLDRVCRGALVVGLEETHAAAFGHPLGRLGAFVASHGWTTWPGTRAAMPSALRLVSWIGAVLSMRAGEGLRLFDIMLHAHRDPLGLPVELFGPGFEACAVPALDPR